jgi:hypothetical protein
LSARKDRRAELPVGVPRGCFGPKVEAPIASLTVRNRLSRRQQVELFGCLITVGTIDRCRVRSSSSSRAASAAARRNASVGL